MRSILMWDYQESTPQILPKVMTKRESLRKPHPDSSYCRSRSEKQVWAFSDYNEGVEEQEWYLSPGWCCFGVVWRAEPGCWGSVCGPGCRRWDAEPQPTGAAQFGGRAKWLSYPGGCKHTQQAWTYLHLWRHGNLMDRKHEAHLASDLLYLYYQMCVCICTLEPSSTARAAVAFDRRASWRAMNETDWNHGGCKTRWNVFCSPATD